MKSSNILNEDLSTKFNIRIFQSFIILKTCLFCMMTIKAYFYFYYFFNFLRQTFHNKESANGG